MPRGQPAPEEASQHQAIQPASTGGDRQAIEASQHEATSTKAKGGDKTLL